MRFLPSTLQKRFLFGLLLIILATSAFFSLLVRNQVKDLFLSEAHSKASLMTAHTEAIQKYVSNVLRPTVSDLVGRDEFVIEAMSSSYVTRQILSSLDFDEDFTYRRVAINARNPASELEAEEIHFLEAFRERPGETRSEERIMLDGRESLVIARPVYFNESCLRCHGDPAAAPAVLISMYGNERGFWRQPGQLAGLDIISVPMESANSVIGKSITLSAICLAVGMLLLLLSVQSFFNRLVVHNLRRVGDILHQKFFRGEANPTLASLRKEVDIEGMIHSIELVAEDLSEAKGQLHDYAKNLENMVRERTSELEELVRERSADVSLFMRLLSDLNITQDKQTLLRTTLRMLAGHFGASRAVYMCGLSGLSYSEWPENDRPDPDLLRQLLDQMRLDRVARQDTVWLIPVQSSGQTRGMLGLYWNSPADPLGTNPHNLAAAAQNDTDGQGDASFQLAVALARQLGIALDNFDSLEILLRQNTLLDSIVEGVSDPLILAERGILPVLTNSSARRLAHDLYLSEPGAEPQVGLAGGSEAISAEEDALVGAMLRDLGLEALLPAADAPVQLETIAPGGRSFQSNLYPLAVIGAQNQRFVIHLRETTEEKRILNHLRQQEKLAAVGQLAAGVAHEINNPLGVIQCYAELMQGSGLDEQNRADLGVILRHVGQARKVLREMLDFSHHRESSPEPCDPGPLLGGLLEVFSAQGRSAKVELNLEVQPNLPELFLDQYILEQALVNLLLNALDSVKKSRTPGSGVITLAARHKHLADEVEITVTDNGHGIPGHLLPKVFDPFFTTKNPGAGTGLGLTIAFGIVNDLGGRLEVESPVYPEGGTRFRVSLPIWRKTPECEYDHAAYPGS